MSITDKEFLTFCNSTNLDWQFIQNIKSQSISNGKENKIYFKLTELLDPEKFIQFDKAGNFKGYPYMPEVQKDSATPEEKDNGLDFMRSKSGVLMNYLEECDCNSREGDFLKEWEARAVKN